MHEERADGKVDMLPALTGPAFPLPASDRILELGLWEPGSFKFAAGKLSWLDEKS